MNLVLFSQCEKMLVFIFCLTIYSMWIFHNDIQTVRTERENDFRQRWKHDVDLMKNKNKSFYLVKSMLPYHIWRLHFCNCYEEHCFLWVFSKYLLIFSVNGIFNTSVSVCRFQCPTPRGQGVPLQERDIHVHSADGGPQAVRPWGDQLSALLELECLSPESLLPVQAATDGGGKESTRGQYGRVWSCRAGSFVVYGLRYVNKANSWLFYWDLLLYWKKINIMTVSTFSYWITSFKFWL